MKKRMKRLLVLLMTAALMVSMLSAGALAEEETAASEETVSEEAAEAEADTAISDTEATASASEAAAEETEETSEADDAEEAAEEASDAEEAAAAAVAEEAEAADEAQADSTATSYSVTVGNGTTYTYSSDDIVIDETKKTITVSQSNTTAGYEIQAAINYIVSLDTDNEDSESGNEDNWTIIVKDGTYCRFVVKGVLDNLCIKAENAGSVVINVLDGSAAGTTTNSGSTVEMGGVIVEGGADYLTIDGLTFQAYQTGSYYGGRKGAAISFFNEAGTLVEYFDIANCTFIGFNGGYDKDGCMGVFVGRSTCWTVENCSFERWYQAICWQCDNYRAVNVVIKGNEFTNCDRAVDGYYGNNYSVNTNFGSLKFINNTVTGTNDLYCRVLISDDMYGIDYDATGYVTLSGNTLENANFLLFDITLADGNNLLNDNTYGDNSFVAISNESAAKMNFTFVGESYEDQVGYWELEYSTYEIGGGTYTLSDEEIEIIEKAIEEANASGSHTITLDFTSIYENDSDNWWKVVTALKYAVHWVGTTSDDNPVVEKTVTSGSTLEAGDTAGFSLTVNVPDYLDIYLEDNISELVTEEGSYIVTVHDEMDSALTLDVDSIAVSVDGVVLDSYRYTLVTSDLEDNCTFEISIDLVSLVEAGILTADEDGNYQDIVITYSATVTEGTAAGTYENTTWVTYDPNGTSETSTVTVTVEEPEEETGTEDDTDDADDTDGADDTDETEDIEEVDASDTGDPGVMLWALILGAALCGIVISRKKIAG